MNEGLIPRRYAKALYKVAVEKHADERVYHLMKALSRSFEAEPRLSGLVANPFVSEADKTKLIMTASGASAGDSVMADFVALLERNKRIALAPAMARAYVAIYRQAHRIYTVKVTTAAEPDTATMDRIKKLITDHLDGGTMEFSHETDPDLIGGFTVAIDNERLDASLRNELERMRLKLISK